MRTPEKMPGHTRLYRRGAVYYHRAAVPQDIVATYGKREETFSLKTRDHAEAVRRVRIAAVEVDKKFDEHRLKLARQQEPTLQELTPEQIATIKAVYLHHLLEEDAEVRLAASCRRLTVLPPPGSRSRTLASHPSGCWHGHLPHIQTHCQIRRLTALKQFTASVSRHEIRSFRSDSSTETASLFSGCEQVFPMPAERNFSIWIDRLSSGC